MEPLLICCLMAHRSRKNGSPTVSWVDRGCGQGLPALPPYSSSQASRTPPPPTSTKTFMAACSISFFWVLVPSPQPLMSLWTLRRTPLAAGELIHFMPLLRLSASNPPKVASRKGHSGTWTLDWLTPKPVTLSAKPPKVSSGGSRTQMWSPPQSQHRESVVSPGLNWTLLPFIKFIAMS